MREIDRIYKEAVSKGFDAVLPWEIELKGVNSNRDIIIDGDKVVYLNGKWV